MTPVVVGLVLAAVVGAILFATLRVPHRKPPEVWALDLRQSQCHALRFGRLRYEITAGEISLSPTPGAPPLPPPPEPVLRWAAVRCGNFDAMPREARAERTIVYGGKA